MKHFSCIDVMKQKWQCKYCPITITGVHMRRRLEHLLGLGTTIKSCGRNASAISEEEEEELLEYLHFMDNQNEKRASKRKKDHDAVGVLAMIPSPMKQTKLNVSCTKMKKREMDLAYAKMIIMSTCRRNFLTSPFTKYFFDHFFNYTPPSYSAVFGSLLQEIYEATQHQVMHKLNLQDADTLLTLTMDAWVAPQGEKIRNYMVVDDSNSWMLKATSTGSKSCTGQAIGEEVIEILDEVGPENFSGIVSDNAANETTSWDTIRDEYPEILTTGCTCHGGNLLYKDVCEHTWSTKLIKKALDVAKFMKHHTWTYCELKSRTKAAGKPMAIILHSPTRFAGSYYTVKRLIELKTVLGEIVINETFAEKKYTGGSDIKKIVLDDNFWVDLTKLRTFLRPLKNFIRAMDRDQHTTHLMYPGLMIVHEHWMELKGTVPSAFHKKAIDHHKVRMEWMIFDVHCAAYALSPEHHEDNIWANRRVTDGLKQVLGLVLQSKEYSVACTEAENFKRTQCEYLFPKDPTMVIKSPKTWWKINGSKWPTLQSAALRIFSVGNSTAPSERNFSAFGHIWNSRSSSFSFDVAQKLVFCYCNLRTLHSTMVTQAEGIEYGWLQYKMEDEE